MRQGVLTLAAGRVRPKEKKSRKKKAEKTRPTENTPRKPQQPGDDDFLETACDETRPTRSPTLARLHRSRVCGNRPRIALAISKNDECYTHTDRHRLINGTLYAPRYKEAFLPKGKKRPHYEEEKKGLRRFAPSALPHY